MNKTRIRNIGKILLKTALAPFNFFLLVISSPAIESPRYQRDELTRANYPYEVYRM